MKLKLPLKVQKGSTDDSKQQKIDSSLVSFNWNTDNRLISFSLVAIQWNPA